MKRRPKFSSTNLNSSCSRTTSWRSSKSTPPSNTTRILCCSMFIPQNISATRRTWRITSTRWSCRRSRQGAAFSVWRPALTTRRISTHMCPLTLLRSWTWRSKRASKCMRWISILSTTLSSIPGYSLRRARTKSSSNSIRQLRKSSTKIFVSGIQSGSSISNLALLSKWWQKMKGSPKALFSTKLVHFTWFRIYFGLHKWN